MIANRVRNIEVLLKRNRRTLKASRNPETVPGLGYFHNPLRIRGLWPSCALSWRHIPCARTSWVLDTLGVTFRRDCLDTLLDTTPRPQRYY